MPGGYLDLLTRTLRDRRGLGHSGGTQHTVFVGGAISAGAEPGRCLKT